MSWASTRSNVGSLVPAVFVSVLLLWLLRSFYHDDAYIGLRYARNLLEGNGLVWNPGERVEGYTSLAWVLLSAGLGRFGIELESATQVLGVASLAGLFLYLALTGRSAGAAACTILAGCGGVLAWSIGGLETILFTSILTICLIETSRILENDPVDNVTVRNEGRSVGNAKRRGNRAFEDAKPVFALGLLFGLLELTRPEGFLLFVLALLWSLPFTRQVRTWRPALHLLLGFAVVFLPRLLFRVAYYGEAFPNTFFVKVPTGLPTTAQGLTYLGQALLAVPALAVFPLLIHWPRRGNAGRSASLYLWTSVGAYLSYLVWIGGDHMPWYRMIVPILPAVFFWCASRLRPAGRRYIATVSILCGLNLVSTFAFASRNNWFWKHRDPAAMGGTIVGLYIRQSWPADALIALNTAGSTAYFSERRCIDMLGLNDKQIAHRKSVPRIQDLPLTALPGHGKGDGAYVLGREPDFIILGGSEGYAEPWFVSDYEISRSPDFQRDYRVQRVRIHVGADGGAPIFTYFERVAPKRRAGTTE